MKRYLIWNIFKVSSSNLTGIAVGIINGFLIPAFLSVEEYSFFRSYGLYISFINLAHFGFIDGINIKYGGLNLQSIDKKTLRSEFKFLFLLELIVASLLLIISILIQNILLATVALSILPLNMITFYKIVLQSTGEFNSYSKLNVVQPLLSIVATLILVFLVKRNNGLYFIESMLLVYYLIFLISIIKILSITSTNSGAKIISSNVLSLIRTGFFLMLGNSLSRLFFSVDRWFVKFSLDTISFGFYSFAISMMNIIVMLVYSVAVTLYPIIVQSRSNRDLLRVINSWAVVLGAFSTIIYFFLKVIIEAYLNKYLPSLSLIAVLFIGLPCISQINILYWNLCKANKRTRSYFITVLQMTILSIFLNLLAIIFNRSMVSIAIATTIVYYVWLLKATSSFEPTRLRKVDILYLTLFVLSFNFSNTLVWWKGLLLHLVILSTMTMLFYKRELLPTFKI